MSSNQESIDKPDEDRRRLQRNKNGEEEPAATPIEESEYIRRYIF